MIFLSDVVYNVCTLLSLYQYVYLIHLNLCLEVSREGGKDIGICADEVDPIAVCDWVRNS